METISSVNPEEITDCANQLAQIFSNLKETYNYLKNDLDSYIRILEDIKSCNQTYTSQPTPDQELGNGDVYQVYIASVRYVTITNEAITLELNQNLNSSPIEDSINIISDESIDLKDLAESLLFYIHIIEKQLSTDDYNTNIFDGNINQFFNGLKNNPNWKEIKEAQTEAIKLKNFDEIYLQFRSTNDEDYDYVDFALDHLGMKFLTDSYSSFPAIWYHNQPDLKDANKTSKSDEWCAEYITYILLNTGNINRIPGAFIDAWDGRIEAENGVGTWHAADSGYQPKRGDIFYKNGHVGIVVGSNNGYIFTIEGNTANDDGKYYVKNYVSTEVPNNKGGYVNTMVRKIGTGKYDIDGGFLTPEGIEEVISKEKREYSTTVQISDEYIERKENIYPLFEEEKIKTGHPD